MSSAFFRQPMEGEALALEKRDEVSDIGTAIRITNELVELTASMPGSLPILVAEYAFGVAAQAVAKLSHLPVERLREGGSTLPALVALVIRLATMPTEPADAEAEAIFETSTAWGSPNTLVDTAEAACSYAGPRVTSLNA